MLMVIPGSDISRHATLMDRVFGFRHSILVDEQGWIELRQPDGLERDRFDDVHAIHQICLRGEEIVGYQRLLPTTRPHLLSDVLTDLCSAGRRAARTSSSGRASVSLLVAARCSRARTGRSRACARPRRVGGWRTGSIPSRSRSIGVSWWSPCNCGSSCGRLVFPSASAGDEAVAPRMSFNRSDARHG
ncbi:acyl-homoserine-lactone synthase (plasmid) [Nitrobacter sp. NHB1]|uniref:acyl-homoserine-lactone synthase n=1 Tax=Nitrobacter sp. NHB1 TaxID=3119830 RepID=UPI002FFDAD9F